MGQERGTVAALCGAEVLTTAGTMSYRRRFRRAWPNGSSTDPERRGSTLAVHTTFGTTMAFLAPLASGLALDLTGNGATVSWRVARFLVLAAGVALGPLALWLLGGRTRGA